MPELQDVKHARYYEPDKQYDAIELYSLIRHLRCKKRLYNLQEWFSWVLTIAGILLYLGGWFPLSYFFKDVLELPNAVAGLLTLATAIGGFIFGLLFGKKLEESAKAKRKTIEVDLQEILQASSTTPHLELPNLNQRKIAFINTASASPSKSFPSTVTEPPQNKEFHPSNTSLASPAKQGLNQILVSKSSNIIRRTRSNNFSKLTADQHLAVHERNQKLGLYGEEFVMRYEKQLLLDAGMIDKAGDILHVSIVNDALGFDIQSFDLDGKPKFIEVKSSTRGEDSDFIITEKEMVNVSTMDNYFLYRVFNFDFETSTGDIYIVNCKDDFNSKFQYWPVVYRVRPNKQL